MITLRVWFVMIVLTLLVVAGRVWNTNAASLHAFQPPPHLTGDGRAVLPTPSTAVYDGPDDLATTAAAPHLDLYGNEVEDALGDYRVDPGGDIYERHSPETEVPRLAPPVS